MNLTGLTRLELHFFGALFAGLAGYIGKRYHVFPGWHVGRFLQQDGYGILRAIVMALGTAYFLPDLLLAVGEKNEALAIVREHPVLMQKALHVLAALIGYTGGSIAFDLIKLLYGLPVVGPYIRKGMEVLGARVRGAGAGPRTGAGAGAGAGNNR